jgi:hypothetical protein
MVVAVLLLGCVAVPQAFKDGTVREEYVLRNV